MEKGQFPGQEARRAKGWLAAHRWLLARRTSQLAILLLFLLGPWFGIWIVKGNIAASLTLDILPLTDPLLLLQMLMAGFVPANAAIIGAVIVLLLYLIVGGRAYCGWVCPINIITDAAEWLRVRLNIKGGVQLARNSRYWLLGAILLISAATGSLAWELVNPVSLVYRGLVFGMGLAWGVVAAIFLLDLFVGRRLWCGHLCPIGAFYGLLGHSALIRVAAPNRAQCDDCMDCYAVCPEQQILRPVLKGAANGTPVVIDSGQCSNCGRCIDVCNRDVFSFTHRFANHRLDTSGLNNQSEVSP